jgi:hypothetical protein
MDLLGVPVDGTTGHTQMMHGILSEFVVIVHNIKVKLRMN